MVDCCLYIYTFIDCSCILKLLSSSVSSSFLTSPVSQSEAAELESEVSGENAAFSNLCSPGEGRGISLGDLVLLVADRAVHQWA